MNPPFGQVKGKKVRHLISWIDQAVAHIFPIRAFANGVNVLCCGLQVVANEDSPSFVALNARFLSQVVPSSDPNLRGTSGSEGTTQARQTYGKTYAGAFRFITILE